MPILSRIILIGAGSLGRELQSWLRTNGHEGRIAFLDDIKPTSRDLPVIGKLEEIGLLINEDDAILVAQARPTDREAVTRRIEKNWPPTVFTHRTAVIAPGTSLKSGSMLLPFTLISTNTRLGRSLLMNTGASIGHDVSVGNYVTLCSNVLLTGNVEVGDSVFFGSGAIVAPGVKIGYGAYIGAGAVVVRDVAPGERVFGNPARTIQIAAQVAAETTA